MAGLFALRVFGRNLLRENRWRNIFIFCFHIPFWFLAWDTNPCFMCNKPTHYLIGYGTLNFLLSKKKILEFLPNYIDHNTTLLLYTFTARLKPLRTLHLIMNCDCVDNFNKFKIHNNKNKNQNSINAWNIFFFYSDIYHMLLHKLMNDIQRYL